MLEPVGPLPPSVYWRRRCLALAAAVVVLVLLVWAVAALAGGSSATSDIAARPAPTRPASVTGADGGQPGGAQPGGAQPSGVQPSGVQPSGVQPSGVQPGGTTRPGVATQPGSASLPTLPTPSGVGRLDPRAALTVPPGGENGPLLGAQGPLATGELAGTPAVGMPAAGTPGAGPQAPGAPRAGAPAAPVPPRTMTAPTVPTRAPGTALPGSPDGPPPNAARAAAPPGPPGPCADNAVRVTARTDKPRYAAGEKPVLAIVITNAGSVPCVRDLDAARQAVAVVRTPGDGLWSSNDCSPLHSDDVRTLAPGQAVSYTVRWSTRTSTPACRGERDQVPPGAYQLLARLDRIVSEPVPFALG